MPFSKSKQMLSVIVKMEIHKINNCNHFLTKSWFMEEKLK